MFENFLQTRDKRTIDIKEKDKNKEEKKEVDERCGSRLLKETRKCFGRWLKSKEKRSVG